MINDYADKNWKTGKIIEIISFSEEQVIFNSFSSEKLLFLKIQDVKILRLNILDLLNSKIGPYYKYDNRIRIFDDFVLYLELI